ncbi:MAG TPA: hypothetical protein PLZ57_01435 [Pseudobdellovibrionaceae bacterium]|nr:hypothetical protein [Pseudobdellovibrionaceae bacterium]
MKFHVLALLALASCLSPEASAWGLHKAFVEPTYRDTYLVQPMLEGRAIRYCLEISDENRVRPSSLDQQVRHALGIYQRVLTQGLRAPKSNFEWVDCASAQLELKVRIADTETATNLGEALPVVERRSGRRYYQITLNPMPRSSPYAGGLNDTLAIFGFRFERFRQSLGRVGDLISTDPSAFAIRHRVSLGQVQSSTWPLLMHELGHAFALCDTYSADTFAQQAHPEHQHNLGPLPRIVGIMGGAGYMNLGHDDVEGLKAARRLVLGEPAAPQRAR